MANPQLEDGYTRIANELMEQLMKLYIAPNHWQVLVCVIRKTYGFRKKIDYITQTQICQGTGLVKSTVSRAINILKQRNIITRDGKYIGLQKDWEQWQKLAEQATKVSETANCVNGEKLAIPQQKLAIPQPELAEQLTKVSSPLDTQKKETIQKKLYKRKKYGEFQNVLLTDEEHEKLLAQFSEADTSSLIEELSGYLENHKRKNYDSHYATLLNWQRRKKEGKGATNRNPRDLPKAYTPTAEYPDL